MGVRSSPHLDERRTRMVIDATDDASRASRLMARGQFVLRWCSPGRTAVVLGACETQEDAQMACELWIDAQLRCALALSATGTVAERYRQRVGNVRIEAPEAVDFSDHDYVQHRVPVLMRQYANDLAELHQHS